jgi:hypothetical protein
MGIIQRSKRNIASERELKCGMKPTERFHLNHVMTVSKNATQPHVNPDLLRSRRRGEIC